jgi:putative SOS response-associated peptidase YedK
MAKDRAFAFAGLWESWKGPDASALESCTIITTEPNNVSRPIHDRMPVILTDDSYDRWLDPRTEDPAALEGLLRPYADDEMTAYPISTLVNKSAERIAGLHRPGSRAPSDCCRCSLASEAGILATPGRRFDNTGLSGDIRPGR